MIDKIRNILDETGITQLELAEKMGMHYSSFNKWTDESIPRSSEKALDLILENHRLKTELAKIKNAVKVLKEC